MRQKVYNELSQWGNITLTIALIAVALLLVAVALLPQHPLFKAIVLAWVVLP